jgi:hypothetical protein
MPFGQQSGPPASAKQVRELLALLKDAGHTDFRDARGPMGFTQLQETQLQETQLQETEPDRTTVGVPAWRQSAPEQILSGMPSEDLAVELRRRGWTVVEP